MTDREALQAYKAFNLSLTGIMKHFDLSVVGAGKLVALSLACPKCHSARQLRRIDPQTLKCFDCGHWGLEIEFKV